MIPRPRWCRQCRRLVLWQRVRVDGVRLRLCQTCGHEVYGLRQPKALRTRKPLGWKRAEAKAAGEVDEFTWQAILAFYGFHCAYCEAVYWQVQDHVVPIAKGGQHCPANVVPSCIKDNQRKGTQTWEPRRRHPFMEAV